MITYQKPLQSSIIAKAPRETPSNNTAHLIRFSRELVLVCCVRWGQWGRRRHEDKHKETSGGFFFVQTRRHRHGERPPFAQF